MSKPIRLQVTALGGRIFAGHPNKAGTNITEGSRHDVTSDFMHCLLQKAEHHGGGGFEIHGGDRVWEVSIKELEPDSKNEDSACES
jgi:hypothetical protein